MSVKSKLASVAAAGVAGTIALKAAKVYGKSRGRPLPTVYTEARTKILIIGGGFGGLAVARGLAEELRGNPEVGVALVDRVNYTTFWPMVPSAISGNVEIRHAAHPLRRILTPLGIEFFQAEAKSVDFKNKTVSTDHDDYDYDYLVLAPGSRTAFRAEGSKENALDLKGLLDALKVRNRILDCFEEAERLRGDHPDDLLTFVFVGAGPTGVEAVADSHDLIFEVLKEDYPRVNFDRVKLILVNSKDRILDGIDPSLANAGSRRLAAQKVEVVNNVHAEEVAPDYVKLTGGRKIPARTTVWAAGIQPPPFVKDLDAPQDRKGNLAVDGSFRVKERPGVYAIGDCVRIDYNGDPVPALAQAAEQEGKLAAKNLAAEISGEPLQTFRYRPLGQLVDLGETSALTDILGVKISGALGALIWRVVYLRELGYNLNRAEVVSDWIIGTFYRPDTSKLLVE